MANASLNSVVFFKSAYGLKIKASISFFIVGSTVLSLSAPVPVPAGFTSFKGVTDLK